MKADMFTKASVFSTVTRFPLNLMANLFETFLFLNRFRLLQLNKFICCKKRKKRLKIYFIYLSEYTLKTIKG